MSLWLKLEMMADHEHVSMLKCSICGKYKDKLESIRNFQPAFIEGTSIVRTSTYKDHALTEMHKRAIHLFKKDQSTSIFQHNLMRLCKQSYVVGFLSRKSYIWDMVPSPYKKELEGVAGEKNLPSLKRQQQFHQLRTTMQYPKEPTVHLLRHRHRVDKWTVPVLKHCLYTQYM